jgi:large subunit ribosomal protein L21
MKKAVIEAGGKQYLVHEGETFNVELIKSDDSLITFVPLLVIDEDKIEVGSPQVATSKVTAQVVEPMVMADKVMSIRYKAKKRVHKIRGHRQKLTNLKITKIT